MSPNGWFEIKKFGLAFLIKRNKEKKKKTETKSKFHERNNE